MMLSKIGEEYGFELTRACFSVMLKFSDELDTFTSFIEVIDLY